MMSNRVCSINQLRRISQLALDKLKPISSQNLNWKTDQQDPRKHNETQLGLFYHLPEDEKTLISIYGAKSPYHPVTTRYYNALGQTPLMIRKPALTAMDYIKKINSLDKPLPNIRILFYGDQGTGKTHTLVHLLHYLHLCQEHIIIHIPKVRRFTRSPNDFEESTSRPGRINTPMDAATLLNLFKIQNAALLEKTKESLLCSQDYKWSLREVTKAGEPLIKIADHGVNRVIHASDCVAVLIKELMLASDQGKIKLASILDDVKFLFNLEAGIIKHKDHKLIYVDEMTVARALKKLIKGTYKGGLVLAACEDEDLRKQNQTPKQVLGIDGWQHFDPCLPINVPVYSRKEFDSVMNFYQDVGWLCRPESCTVEARDEIRFLSAMNPLQVASVCESI